MALFVLLKMAITSDSPYKMLSTFLTPRGRNLNAMIFINMVTLMVAALISMPAKAEDFAMQSGSEKTQGVLQNKVEIRAMPRPATGSIEQCGQMLRGVSDESKQVKRVRKTLKKNLHFRPLGSGHLILRPGWYSDFDDAIAACSDMRENDIPVLVSLVAREKQGGSVRVIAYDILRILHTKALPCIEAGMVVYPEGASDFSALKSTIERDVVEISHNPAGFAFNPKSCQMHPEPSKGGKQP